MFGNDIFARRARRLIVPLKSAALFVCVCLRFHLFIDGGKYGKDSAVNTVSRFYEAW
jgi:hypothetical protein